MTDQPLNALELIELAADLSVQQAEYSASVNVIYEAVNYLISQSAGLRQYWRHALKAATRRAHHVQLNAALFQIQEAHLKTARSNSTALAFLETVEDAPHWLPELIEERTPTPAEREDRASLLQRAAKAALKIIRRSTAQALPGVVVFQQTCRLVQAQLAPRPGPAQETLTTASPRIYSSDVFHGSSHNRFFPTGRTPQF